MTDANEMCETIMQELNNLVIFDKDEGGTIDEQESFLFHEEQASDEIPQSLLSYFETSKSRAAVCEKLILEELEDLTASHHTEDMKIGDLPTALDEDMMTLHEPVMCGTENEENNTFADTRLLPAPTETEALFTHNVSVCHNKEDEAGTDEYTECEQHLALDVMTHEISVNEDERKRSNEYEVEREKRHCQEMKNEEQRRQREKDFQDELKKIMEAEKLHQKEVELMGKRAQEKLEQELLLQQELISNLQGRVAEERKKKEEEQKRMKEEKQRRMKEEEERRKREEENRRKWEEVKSKIEAERKRTEEETRRTKEEAEKRKIEEIRLKEEEERRRKQEEGRKKREEEEKRRREKEENKKKEEEKHQIELEKKKLEDEMRMMREEEKRNERIKEEERKRVELARKKFEEEKNGKMEEEMRQKKEEEWRKRDKEEQKRREEKHVRTEKDVTIIKEVEERKQQEETRKEEEEDDRKKIEAERKMMYEEMRKKGEKEHENRDEEIRLDRTKKAEKERKTREEEEERKSEKKINLIEEEKKEMEEGIRRMEEEDRKLEEEKRTKEEDEKRKKKDERKAKKEERRRQEEEMRRQREEEDYRKTQEEIRLKEEKDGNKGCEADSRKMEPERKNKYEEKNQEVEDLRKMEDGRKNTEAEKRQIEEKVRENKEVKTEERRLKEEDESTKIKEKAETLMRLNDLQEKKRENKSMKTQNEREKSDNTGNSQISQLEDSTTQNSSSPLHSESTVSPTITETVQQHDPNTNINQSSVHKTDSEVRPSTSSGSLLLCLPEHTEQKRLSWMKDCIPWSKLSLQNRRKQRGSVRSRRGPRRVAEAEASSLPPLCPDTLLQATGWKSLQEVTTVTLEDLPGCSLSTLAQCRQLRSLTLRRCGLKALEGINQLPELCYIDVQENDISFVDCENMTSLRVLRLGQNKLMSIHGLSGADNLNVLDLSYNSITRIAGLESTRRLQRLSVDHNQLISTKGLRDVYTLLHLDCSYNHLASVEGLENSALLNTLDLTANSLAEPPSLNNQVLLRELRLDDNSISSLRGLTACWLPLMQIVSVAQNRITQLPSMSDFVSLANLDLQFNCLSELKNVCESLEGCQFLQEVHLMGNPLEQESGWRSALQKAAPVLRAIDGQETDSFLSPPAVQQVSLASGSFLTFCQAQLQRTRDLQRQHSEELSNASLPLDSVKTYCRHFTEALQLAEDQRFAHEYGDTTAADKQRGAGQTTPEETLDEDSSNAGQLNERTEMEFTGKVSPLIPREDNIRSSYWTFEENLTTESRHDTSDTVTAGPKMKSAVCKVNSGSFHSFATKGKMTNLKKAAVSNHQDLNLKNTAAVVIQQQWRKYRQKCWNIGSPPTAEKGGGKGGDGGKPESGPSFFKWNVVGQDHAATVIQAFWRGFTLRRRLTSALAAVTCPNTGEDDTFEEVDMDEFVFDEAALEKDWTLPLSEDSPPRCYSVSEQPLSQKPPGPSPEPSQYILPPPPVWRPKQAWVDGEQVDSAGQRVSPESFDRSKSPASTSMLSGLSKRSEKILEEWGFTDSHTALQMLKRAQKMKSKKQQQKKRLDPSVRLALFRNCTYQPGPVEARNRPAPRNRNYIKVGEAELGLQQAEKTEQAKQERAQEWLHSQAAQSDRDSESERFLPEISSDILNGGRVQLVAEPGYTDRLHHASGLWANSSLAAQPCKENNYPRRNSLGHAKKEVPSPKRVTSAPSKKERISYRDNPVQLSGGWGGGKKRDKVYK